MLWQARKILFFETEVVEFWLLVVGRISEASEISLGSKLFVCL
jgi:hypothetical protein